MANFFYVRAQRLFDNAGRDEDKSYINVLTQLGTHGTGTFAEFVSVPPWNDPAFPEFLIELQRSQFNAFKRDKLLHASLGNLPRWQWNAGALEFGSWADPEDAGSVWRTGVEIPDDRWILRVYDGNPLTTGVHVAQLDLDAGPPNKPINLRIFNSDDTPNSTNDKDQRVRVSGRFMIFDFTNGVTVMTIENDRPGTIDLDGDSRYRFEGPGGEKSFRATIFARTLGVNR